MQQRSTGDNRPTGCREVGNIRHRSPSQLSVNQGNGHCQAVGGRGQSRKREVRLRVLRKLSEYGPDQLDELHRLLDDWTLDMAKVVLDEIGRRVKLVDELRDKTSDDSTLEVQELQPLFERGLWIFGPEFETIEYTSNEGMTSVIQKLYGCKGLTGSRNRPDFAILADGSVGLYSLSRFDKAGGEIGIERLVIVELKKPSVPLGTEQKTQCWKYVKELYEKGLLQEGSQVRCFVVGKTISVHEEGELTEKDGDVVILPLVFDTILNRAKSRLLKLYDRVKGAPFLQKHKDQISSFLRPINTDPNLFKRQSQSKRRPPAAKAST